MEQGEKLPLFDKDEFDLCRKEWKGMPEFNQRNLEAFKTIMVNFETQEDMIAFSKLINQIITHTTKSIWFPKVTYEKITNKRYVDES